MPINKKKTLLTIISVYLITLTSSNLVEEAELPEIIQDPLPLSTTENQGIYNKLIASIDERLLTKMDFLNGSFSKLQYGGNENKKSVNVDKYSLIFKFKDNTDEFCYINFQVYEEEGIERIKENEHFNNQIEGCEVIDANITSEKLKNQIDNGKIKLIVSFFLS